MIYRKYSGACDVRDNDAVMCPRQAIRHILPDFWSREEGISLCAVHLEQLREELAQHCAALTQHEEEEAMPMLETVTELAEALADMLGVYSQRLQKEGLTIQETRKLVDETGGWNPDFDHADTCECRRCWCGSMERRIRAAVANEQRLAPQEET